MSIARVIILALVVVSAATAHLANGEDVVVEGMLINFGYDPGEPQAGDRVTLLFNLVNATTEQPIEYTSLWMRISSVEDVVFTGEFSSTQGNVILSHTFNEPGMYEITSRFKDGEDIIVEHDFHLGISGDQLYRYSWGTVVFWIEAAVILVLVIALVILSRRVRNV